MELLSLSDCVVFISRSEVDAVCKNTVRMTSALKSYSGDVHTTTVPFFSTGGRGLGAVSLVYSGTVGGEARAVVLR